MKESVFRRKSLEFAIRIVNVYKYLCVVKAVLRLGTSVGAMVREFVHAESKADFKYKLAIAQKDTSTMLSTRIYESIYWLEIL